LESWAKTGKHDLNVICVIVIDKQVVGTLLTFITLNE